MIPRWTIAYLLSEGKVVSIRGQPCLSSALSVLQNWTSFFGGPLPLSRSISLAHSFSLQDALYEPAVEYYTSHSKRVRRKRNRHSQTSSYNPPPLIPVGATNPRPLRPEGWTVRYEYKMACFAEFRGEDQVALKYVRHSSSVILSLMSYRHYQDAYTTLMIMFGSTAILPPRTKRWAEAKVLSDTINFKVRHTFDQTSKNTHPSSDHKALPLQQRTRPRPVPSQPPHASFRRLFTWLGHRRGDV